MSFTNRSLFNILRNDGVMRPGRALELGSGRGIDAETLSRNGYDVDAVDASPEVLRLIVPSPFLHPHLSKIEDFLIPENAFTLISCQYVLHFLHKDVAKDAIRRMVAGAVPGGVISFNLLGEQDAWKDKWTTWTRVEADAFMTTLPATVHKIITEEGQGMTRAGVLKYWHVLNYVLIKTL